VLEVQVAEGCGDPVMGDPVRLRQVLGNLLSNAVKFTAAGRVDLLVSRQAEIAAFEVRDTGIGFSPDQAERLFDRFVQADGSITRDFGGSGLGLAICRELIEMMGGQIAALGEPGKGAVFRVSVPLPDIAVADRPVHESATM
jgi:signal transduction histidine kinase